MGNHTKGKVLFVGKERICKQIAYVLNIQDYALAEKLTKRNVRQYHDHQIYVCEFKHKSRKFVKLGGGDRAQSNIQYLDDTCRSIDEEYYANRERHKNDFKNFQESLNTKTTSPDKKTTTKSVVAETAATTVQPNLDLESIKKETSVEVHQPLWWRIMRGMKHPFRAAWHVVLRTKETVKRRRIAMQEREVQRECRKKYSRKNLYKRDSQYLQKYLRNLKPSELLLYVLRAPINKRIKCVFLENAGRIGLRGEFTGCCSAMVPFGNIIFDGELGEIYNSTFARIIKLSSLNRSYCLCDFNTWCNGYHSKGKIFPIERFERWQTATSPQKIFLSFDHSCNLCCKACRTEPYILDDVTRNQTVMIVEKLLRSGYLEQTHKLTISGSGEAFYSPFYRKLLTNDLQRKNIKILSNGTLFNENNWRLLEGKYTTIDVTISVDAATPETYQKLRGADFENLMRNLNMLSDLHRQKQIHRFRLNFVVQRDNFQEMPAFVELGQLLGVDQIQFQRMKNFGHFTAQEYSRLCLIIDNKYLDYELWCVLQDPIFKDPIVDLKGLQRYIDASEHRYRRRYEREQKSQSV